MTAARLNRLRKLGIFAVSLFLFTLSLYLMKTGARALAPFIRNLFHVTNPANALGFGWLFAYVTLSGSPAAAAALTFLDAGVVDAASTFAMITGSRIGASMVVLFLGFIYVLRGHDRVSSLTMGLQSLLITASSYVLGLPLGFWLLQNGVANTLHPRFGLQGESLLDGLFMPIVNLVTGALPLWAAFPLGLGLVVLSFHLIDKALPEVSLSQDSVFGGVARLPYRPIVIFLLGLAVTTFTMSVSVSLGILVPLSARGYIRSENAVPYIMGCNVSTFVDTLMASMLIANPLAFTVVLVQMMSMAVVSLFALIFLMRPYQRLMVVTAELLLKRRWLLTAFLTIILFVPVGLVLFAH
jgi:sodium-dependent phosphate cotransporter